MARVSAATGGQGGGRGGDMVVEIGWKGGYAEGEFYLGAIR